MKYWLTFLRPPLAMVGVEEDAWEETAPAGGGKAAGAMAGVTDGDLAMLDGS